MENNKLIRFEKILNQVIPRSFPWWKKIDIFSIRYSSTSERASIVGMLEVDQDWIEEQYYHYHFKPYFNDNFDNVFNPDDTRDLLQFGDIVGLRDDGQTKKLYNIITYIGDGILQHKYGYNYTITNCGVKGDL